MIDRFRPRALAAACDAFAEVETLVVSDEYPPDTVGGAEISLHSLLTAALAPEGVLVVRFSMATDRPLFHRQDGIRVLTLPDGSAFRPVAGETTIRRLKRLKVGPISAMDVLCAARNIGLYGLSRARLRAYAALLDPKPPAGGIGLDHLPEQFHARAFQLAWLVARLNPRTVLCNNTRSILSLHYARQQRPAAFAMTRCIAMVRDNRFVCARHNQLMRTQGRDCLTCDFACAREDGPGAPDRQARLLNAVRAIRQEALRQADAVIVASAYLEKQVRGLVDRSTSVHRVANFAEVPDSALSADRSVTADRHIVTVVGSLNDQKGQLAFVENSLAVLAARPNLEIHLAGRGQAVAEAITRLSREHGLEDRIRLTGFLDRDNLYRALRQSSVVVLPTLWPEPFGRVPLEAAACGRPVVAFDTGAFGETIVDGATGHLVPKEDYPGLWERIISLLDDPESARKMGKAAHERTAATFSRAGAVQAFRQALSDT